MAFELSGRQVPKGRTRSWSRHQQGAVGTAPPPVRGHRAAGRPEQLAAQPTLPRGQRVPRQCAVRQQKEEVRRYKEMASGRVRPLAVSLHISSTVNGPLAVSDRCSVVETSETKSSIIRHPSSIIHHPPSIIRHPSSIIDVAKYFCSF